MRIDLLTINFRIALVGALAVIWLFLAGCAAVPPMTEEELAREARRVEEFFVTVRVAIRDGDGEKVYHSLSQQSKGWFLEMRSAADSEPLNFVRNRPFFEILSILSLRIHYRLNPFAERDPVSLMKKIVIQTAPINKSLTKHSLGPFRVHSGGKADVGLKKAENTPVFFFNLEGKEWRFDLIQSLPLILLGVESLARQKKAEPLSQAVYIIEEVFKQKLEPEDYRL